MSEDQPKSKLLIGDAERLRLEARIAEELDLARRLNEQGRHSEALEATRIAEELRQRLETLQRP